MRARPLGENKPRVSSRCSHVGLDDKPGNLQQHQRNHGLFYYADIVLEITCGLHEPCALSGPVD